MFEAEGVRALASVSASNETGAASGSGSTGHTANTVPSSSTSAQGSTGTLSGPGPGSGLSQAAAAAAPTPPAPTPQPNTIPYASSLSQMNMTLPPLLSSSTDDGPQTTAELMSICRSFIDQLRSGSAPWLLQRLNNTYGSMPTDPSEFSYWMALVMPIDEYEKARLLPIRSPRLRLKVIVHWVESLRGSWWFSSG